MAWQDEAIAAVAAERGRALVGYAYLFTGSVPAAEDLVQEALVRTFLRARSGTPLRDPVAAEGYVRRTIATMYVDDYRRRRRWTALVPRLAATDRDRVGEPADRVDHLDLRAALTALAPRERACVVLRYYEDLTVADIAERLGLETGTVKRYLSQAVARLGHELAAGFDQDDDVIIRRGS